MAKEVEEYDRTADLQPMYGPGGFGGGMQPYDGGGSYVDEGPEWFDPIPPYGYGDSVKEQIDKYWSYIARWPRYVAKGFLWVTFSFWRFLYVIGTVGLLIFALTSKGIL